MSGLRAVLGIHAVSQPAGTSAAVSVAGQVCGLGWGLAVGQMETRPLRGNNTQ